MNDGTIVENVEYWAFGGGFEPTKKRVCTSDLVEFRLEDVASFSLANSKNTDPKIDQERLAQWAANTLPNESADKMKGKTMNNNIDEILTNAPVLQADEGLDAMPCSSHSRFLHGRGRSAEMRRADFR